MPSLASMKLDWLSSNECLEFCKSNNIFLQLLESIQCKLVPSISFQQPNYSSNSAYDLISNLIARHLKTIRDGNAAATIWMAYMRFVCDRILKIAVESSAFIIPRRNTCTLKERMLVLKMGEQLIINQIFAKLKSDF